MSNQRRLGRGLEALLGRSLDAPAASGASQADPSVAPIPPSYTITPGEDVTRSDDGQQWLPLGVVDRNPYQPRTNFDEAEIADLCDSIRVHGFLQPIVVRKHGERYQLIAGERRLRAAQMANWERIPVQVREATDRIMAELAIVENIQRKDLNAIEKATSFQRYIQEYGCTQEELAGRVNIDRSTVANLVRLLELPAEVQTMIGDGSISAGHARALLPLGDESEQFEFARRIAKESLSVRATESAVKDRLQNLDGGLSIIDAEGNSRPSPMQPGQHLRDLEEQLRLALGTKVDLKQSAKGKGRITIHFASHEEFDRLKVVLTGAGQQQADFQVG
ncbi:MAG: ParB/RepB/Spo0J family partition protein [Planctomycetales bacterium]|nr:ParB/RepB/Spo0J family partition protein [Planctomycetales bacterium]